MLVFSIYPYRGRDVEWIVELNDTTKFRAYVTMQGNYWVPFLVDSPINNKPNITYKRIMVQVQHMRTVIITKRISIYLIEINK